MLKLQMFHLKFNHKQIIAVGVHISLFCVFIFSESEKSKDWEQQISQMKQAFEKQLQSERTLKTQVSLFKSSAN